jgi:small-conductance mechanosensitive channel
MAISDFVRILKGIKTHIHWTEVLALALLIVSKISEHQVFARLSFPLEKVDIICNFLIFLLTIDNIRQVSEYIYREKRGYKPTRTDNLMIGMGNIYYLIVVGASLSTILSLFGLNFSTFFTSISIVAAALAVLSKDYVGSIISGMILAFSEEASVGDYVEIGGGTVGKIIDMNLTRVVLLTDDDEVIYIPNNTVFGSNIINHTKRGTKKTIINFELRWDLVKNIDDFEAELVAHISEFHNDIDMNSFRLSVKQIKYDFVQLKFQYTLTIYSRQIEKEIKKKLERFLVAIISDVNPY